MTAKKLQAYLLKTLVALCATIIVILPFHALLTVWAADNFGHYTIFRLWKELLLGLATVLAIILLALNKDLARRFAKDWLLRLIGIYAVIILIAGLVGWQAHAVTKTAAADGVLLDLRFLLFFAITWLVTQRTLWLYTYWRRLLLYPAAVVIGLGLAQRFGLPYDFLKHFGYGPNTISPYETIDHKNSYIRVQSSLRGANPLGAYLVLIGAAVTTIFMKTTKRWRPAIYGIACLTVLFFTYSRSAWIGAVVSMAIVLYLANTHNQRLRNVFLFAATAVLLLAAGLTFALRHNDRVQNTFFHTDEHSTSVTSSNTGHLAALTHGLKDIARQPLGGGTGSAGPASAHNMGRVRIAENYFLQIGQEVGLVGLLLFIAINVMVGQRLWRHRHDRLDVALLASLVGISLVCLFSHAWTDDTLAYIWWGLAGIATAKGAMVHATHNKN